MIRALFNLQEEYLGYMSRKLSGESQLGKLLWIPWGEINTTTMLPFQAMLSFTFGEKARQNFIPCIT